MLATLQPDQQSVQCAVSQKARERRLCWCWYCWWCKDWLFTIHHVIMTWHRILMIGIYWLGQDKILRFWLNLYIFAFWEMMTEKDRCFSCFRLCKSGEWSVVIKATIVGIFRNTFCILGTDYKRAYFYFCTFYGMCMHA